MTTTPFVVGTELVSNDPASTTGPGRVLPIYIQGDAPAPVNFEFTGVSGTRDRILLANISGSTDYLGSHSAQLAGAQTLTTANTGAVSPNSAIGDVGSGDVSWSNPANIFTSDNVRAQVTLQSGQTSRALDATGFDFGIPADATPTGIVVEIERFHPSADAITDFRILTANGTALTNAITDSTLVKYSYSPRYF